METGPWIVESQTPPEFGGVGNKLTFVCKDCFDSSEASRRVRASSGATSAGRNVSIKGARWPKWLEREFTDLKKVRGSNPTSATRLPRSKFGYHQPRHIYTSHGHRRFLSCPRSPMSIGSSTAARNRMAVFEKNRPAVEPFRCHATLRLHEGWDTARLPKPRQGKSRGRGQVRTTDLLISKFALLPLGPSRPRSWAFQHKFVVRTRPLPLDFPYLGLGNLARSQPSCNLWVAWQLGTERFMKFLQVAPVYRGVHFTRGRDGPSGLGNLAVSQPSCFLRVQWQLGTGRVLQLDPILLLISYILHSTNPMNVKTTRDSNPASQPFLSRLGQPGSISAFVLLSGGMAHTHLRRVTSERSFYLLVLFMKKNRSAVASFGAQQPCHQKEARGLEYRQKVTARMPLTSISLHFLQRLQPNTDGVTVTTPWKAYNTNNTQTLLMRCPPRGLRHPEGGTENNTHLGGRYFGMRSTRPSHHKLIQLPRHVKFSTISSDSP
ncbi:LOW QUALITY PROTEIN: hypothetical protein T265_15468 [Opisthorchis viverrini]|uniref:Uncharacterized protein n=1 Tax=Opisthorchis viverrini TaxID=6198 RepID=A0A074YYJ2_OPIVI|nr:LOW QUALITY PROTEIN: hypothetical protein T265_15468 [Opisthorchis viverrini]KER19713.1 LOW QUALITY PROTEIN: hypothetical protein T265_15468 [Opisthorchis viverrini]